jgi:RecJ-like exonuclease
MAHDPVALFNIDQYKLTIACVIIAVVGLLVLAFYISTMTPKHVELSELSLTPLGAHISIEGTVEKIKTTEKTTTFTVCDITSLNCVDVRIFKSVPFVFEDDTVRVNGVLKEWQDNIYLEVKSANDIEVIR